MAGLQVVVFIVLLTLPFVNFVCGNDVCLSAAAAEPLKI